jgi:hypothetical protein
LICVQESGGSATDSDGGVVTFPERTFRVNGGVVCASRWATDEQRAILLAAAKRS